MSSSRDAVRVVVRIRGDGGGQQHQQRDDASPTMAAAVVREPLPTPGLYKEIECARDGVATSVKGLAERFTFDTVFSAACDQVKVYDGIARPAVASVLEGFNTCILGFGQTSSGKTYTMFGPGGGDASLLASEQRGLVPRIMTDLLIRLHALPAAELTWTVEMSIFELYNENLYDLLTPTSAAELTAAGVTAEAAAAGGGAPTASAAAAEVSNNTQQQQQQQLRIREDRGAGGRGVFVEGIVRLPIRTAAEACALIADASRRKHLAGTLMNRTSSRSHPIGQLFVSQVNNVAGGTRMSSQFYMVDLAGSEKVSRTGATGDRLREAQSINLSLTLLGNVINKLTDPACTHIPYRDSKLTRLLQDALGGNATTTLLCAVSASPADAA